MFKILSFIYTHPLNINRKFHSIINFIKWQLSSRLWGQSLVYNWIGDSKLIVSKGMTGATGNVYVGLMEYEEMSFLLHYLSNEDLFFDIGANVGVYTILASKVKGARTISIEPLPSTFEKLVDDIQINRLHNKVIYKNIGLSYQKSKLHFTVDKDTMNRVATNRDRNVVEVNVDTLDSLTKDLGVPSVIKIDVEGYETNVLNGAADTLLNESLEVIIIELNGSGKKYGFDDGDIHSGLLLKGFQSFHYNPLDRELTLLDKYGEHNTIYIRTKVLDKIKKLLKNSLKININGLEI